LFLFHNSENLTFAEKASQKITSTNLGNGEKIHKIGMDNDEKYLKRVPPFLTKKQSLVTGGLLYFLIKAGNHLKRWRL